MTDTPYDIFISHAEKDGFIIREFVDVILDNGMGIQREKIFCISVDGMGIKSGADFRDSIRNNLKGCKVAIIMATPNYRMSEMCLNEMGAAWALDCQVLPCIIDNESNFMKVGVLMNVKQAENLLRETDLDELREAIEKKLGAREKASLPNWTFQKKRFLDNVQSYILKTPYPDVVTNAEFQKMKQKNRDLDEALGKSVSENTALRKMTEELIAAKDKQDVEAITDKYENKSEMEKFKTLVGIVSNCLDQFQPVVNAFIYSAITGNELEIDYGSYSAEIKDAIAEKYLDDSSSIPKVDWYSTDEMDETQKAIASLKKFMESSSSLEFFEQHQKVYGVSPDLTNINFWKKVIRAKIIYR